MRRQDLPNLDYRKEHDRQINRELMNGFYRAGFWALIVIDLVYITTHWSVA